MTIKEAKEKLQQVLWDNKYLEVKAQEIEKQKIKSEKLTLKLSHSASSDKLLELEETIRKIDNLKIREAEYFLLIESNKLEFEKTLSSVSQPYRIILYYKYVIGYSNEEIARAMQYSPPRIYQLLAESIAEYARLMS